MKRRQKNHDHDVTRLDSHDHDVARRDSHDHGVARRDGHDHGVTRRDFIKTGFAALSTLALGETIFLTPTDAEAQLFGKKKVALAGQRKAKRRANGKGRLQNDYTKAKVIKSVCLNCSTVCGIQGYVIDGNLVKVGGNPEDPNNGQSLCAKGQSGPTINDYPERLLFP